MTEAQTISVAIEQPPADVYAYLADPAHFPEWSQFVTAIQPNGEDWRAQTSGGEVRMRFSPPNAHGILDHEVTAGEKTVSVPLRVVRNGEGSEVLFTVFRQPGMTTRDFEEDLAVVGRDLRNLRRLLEAGAAAAR